MKRNPDMDKWAVWAGTGCMAVFPISGLLFISPPCTGLGFIISHWLCEYEVKNLRSPACSRIKNAIFSPHIHATDGK